MALAHRLKKLESAIRPERQFFVIPTFELCGHVDDAALTRAEAERRAGDIYLMRRMWLLCPRCEQKDQPKATIW